MLLAISTTSLKLKKNRKTWYPLWFEFKHFLNWWKISLKPVVKILQLFNVSHSSYLTRQAAIRNRSGASVGSWKPRGPISQSAQVKYFIPSFDLLNQNVSQGSMDQVQTVRSPQVRDYLKPMLSNVNISSTDHHRLISSSSLSVVNAELNAENRNSGIWASVLSGQKIQTIFEHVKRGASSRWSFHPNSADDHREDAPHFIRSWPDFT